MARLVKLACGLELQLATSENNIGTFKGYGSVFNRLNTYDEVIAPGAFAKSLSKWKQRGNLPKMLLQHGGGFFGGSTEDGIPVGKYDVMQEDSKGLEVEGKLFALNTQKGQYIYEGLQSKALDGLSIGFCPVTYTTGQKDGEPERTHTEVDLWECSIVTFPADGGATISEVRSGVPIEELIKFSDYEDYLREVGFSRLQAKAFVSRFAKTLRQSDAERESAVDALSKFLNKHTPGAK